MIDRDNLNHVMEFDHVIRVHEDGTVDTTVEGVHAPELYDEELDTSTGWRFFSTGYSGQDSYNGPIMHASEFIGGRLADDILSTPGLFVAVVSYLLDLDDEDDELDVTGWAVLHREES